MKRKTLIGQVRNLPPSSQMQSLCAPSVYSFPLRASELTLQLSTSDKTEKRDGTRCRRWPLSSSQGGGIFLAGFQVWHRSVPHPLLSPERETSLAFWVAASPPECQPQAAVSAAWYGGAAGRAKDKWHLRLAGWPCTAVLSPGLFLAPCFFAGWATAQRRSSEATAMRRGLRLLSCLVG